MPAHSPAQVLLVRMSSLGDIVHTFPAVTDLMRERPATVLHWVVEEQYVALARMHPGVARVIPVALRRWRHFGRGAWDEFCAFRAAMRATAYAAVIDAQGLLKSVFVARQARGPLYGFDVRTARESLAGLCYPHTVGFPPSAHKITRYRGLVAAANGYAPGQHIDYGLTPPAPPAWVPAGPYAVLLHSTARATKLWSEPAWISVAAALAARGVISVLPFGNVDEEARARRIAAAVPPALVPALVPPPMGFVEAAGLLAHAGAVIGLDTGFTHLAAAFNTPVVGVFCDSEPVDAHPVGMGPTAYCGAIGAAPSVTEVLVALDRVAPALGVSVAAYASAASATSAPTTSVPAQAASGAAARGG